MSEKRTIKLLHGTNSSVIESIFKYGLLPEGFTNNAMFNYNDYGRKGKPKHPECIYLTDDLENAKRYAANAVKHNGGFPIIIEVEVNTDALTWDDDAFYRNYGDFDFGEKDIETGEWIRKPEKELWEQSLEINNQCAHYGKIPKSQFTRIYLDSKWWTIEQFEEIYQKYKEFNLRSTLLNENDEIYLKEFKIELDKFDLSLDITILNRIIYFYNLKNEVKLSNLEKVAFSIKLMQFVKENIKEFGAKIISASNLRTIGLNPKKSSFNYVFGVFEIKSNDDIIEDIKEKIDRSFKDKQILKDIIEGKASEEDFNQLYEFNPDFIEELIDYCKNILNYDDNKVLETLTNIKNKYHDIYDELQAEIEYLQHQLQ